MVPVVLLFSSSRNGQTARATAGKVFNRQRSEREKTDRLFSSCLQLKFNPSSLYLTGHQTNELENKLYRFQCKLLPRHVLGSTNLGLTVFEVEKIYSKVNSSEPNFLPSGCALDCSLAVTSQVYSPRSKIPCKLANLQVAHIPTFQDRDPKETPGPESRRYPKK